MVGERVLGGLHTVASGQGSVNREEVYPTPTHCVAWFLTQEESRLDCGQNQ